LGKGFFLSLQNLVSMRIFDVGQKELVFEELSHVSSALAGSIVALASLTAAIVVGLFSVKCLYAI